MKASRRNNRNAHAQAEKRSEYNPNRPSKYAAKRRGYVEEPGGLTRADVEFGANYDFHKDAGQ